MKKLCYILRHDEVKITIAIYSIVFKCENKDQKGRVTLNNRIAQHKQQVWVVFHITS
jgi:hypothetical protein